MTKRIVEIKIRDKKQAPTTHQSSSLLQKDENDTTVHGLHEDYRKKVLDDIAVENY